MMSTLVIGGRKVIVARETIATLVYGYCEVLALNAAPLVSLTTLHSQSSRVCKVP